MYSFSLMTRNCGITSSCYSILNEINEKSTRLHLYRGIENVSFKIPVNNICEFIKYSEFYVRLN